MGQSFPSHTSDATYEAVADADASLGSLEAVESSSSWNFPSSATSSSLALLASSMREVGPRRGASPKRCSVVTRKVKRARSLGFPEVAALPMLSCRSNGGPLPSSPYPPDCRKSTCGDELFPLRMRLVGDARRDSLGLPSMQPVTPALPATVVTFPTICCLRCSETRRSATSESHVASIAEVTSAPFPPTSTSRSVWFPVSATMSSPVGSRTTEVGECSVLSQPSDAPTTHSGQ